MAPPKHKPQSPPKHGTAETQKPKLLLSNLGVEARLLMTECQGPSNAAYDLNSAKQCMQLIHLVLWNRLKYNPGELGAGSAKTVNDIIDADGFKSDDAAIAANLEKMLTTANDPNDRLHGAFADFAKAAIDVANSKKPISDSSKGLAATWRKTGANSPGSDYTKFKTVGGNDFYRYSPPQLQLDPRPTLVGAETRLLMAECQGPSMAGYSLDSAKRCMQLMDLVLWNRLKHNPAQFGAKNANTIIDIIKARGQFRGFEAYPSYSGGIAQMLQSILNIANDPRDSRHADFARFVNVAIEVANAATIQDPSPSGAFVAAWRTVGSGSPGSRFTKFETVGGNEFYSLAE